MSKFIKFHKKHIKILNINNMIRIERADNDEFLLSEFEKMKNPKS